MFEFKIDLLLGGGAVEVDFCCVHGSLTLSGAVAPVTIWATPLTPQITAIKLPYYPDFTVLGDWSCYAPSPGSLGVREYRAEALQALA